MKNFNKISLNEVSENQVLSSRVAKTEQPDAEGLKLHSKILSNPDLIVRKEIEICCTIFVALISKAIYFDL